ncbi:MAG: hypothetical protein L0H73_12540 [Nitrococcus sp.]|nr:hypothetical protein [Nitrococcus sp.]
MAMTNAQKQRAYRQRHLSGGTGEIIKTVVSVSTKRQLERLARHHGVTRRAMLERLLAAAEREVVSGIADTAAYYAGTGAARQGAPARVPPERPVRRHSWLARILPRRAR